jgi:AcrR family transcriptional regulator
MASLTRESIARAAIAIADEEGLDAVSMRRVAARLDVGTMSLYHYVATKSDLFTVVADAIMAGMLIPPGEVPAGWREGLTELARRARTLFERHAWVLASWHRSERATPGASFLGHVDQTLAVMADLECLSFAERLHLSGLVDEYVIGHVTMAAAAADWEPGDAQTWFVTALADEGSSYPHLAAALAAGLPEPGEDDFEAGLQVVLDGIEAYVARRRACGP